MSEAVAWDEGFDACRDGVKRRNPYQPLPGAAAVPEAQDGRQREDRWIDLLGRLLHNEPRPGFYVAAARQLMALADREGTGPAYQCNYCDDDHGTVPLSIAVREGERERLAAAWDYGWRAGWDDRESGDGQVTPNAYWPDVASPSLAAPEGTGAVSGRTEAFGEHVALHRFAPAADCAWCPEPSPAASPVTAEANNERTAQDG